ncbi:MAG: ABC transporter permease, partial [Streptococcaceae bacterium]|nr:ABC transporter permease [Streptococcaceae bacterium]
GRGITSKDKDTNNVVISEDLAKDNSLTLGSTFKIAADSDSEAIEVTVVGIYSTTSEIDEMMMRNAAMNPVNKIYGYLTLANTLKGSDDADTLSSAVYNLEDPKEMTEFVKSAKKLIDSDELQLQTNDTMYQQMITPLNNVAKFATNVVWLVSIAGIIILTLIVVMMIRERKYEIGVLMSLGEAKFKIISQFFVELIIVMLIAVGIASVSGNVVGNIVGQQLLDQQNSAQQTSASSSGTQEAGNRPGGGDFGARIGQGFGVGQTTQEAQAIEKLNVKLSPKEIALLGLIALAIAVFAVLIASIGILRLQPKDILSAY